MARSCGLRIGPRRFELVVLDGGPRKHKITAYTSGEFPEDRDPESIAEILKEAVRSTNAPKENIGFAVDTRLAAFRTLKLPFTDRAKIEQVLKFEVESELPQWNVDDVVVDYHTMDTSGDTSELMVSAVPKPELAKVLEIAAMAGIEPLELELETSAMVNAALTADICGAEDSQVLVHVGEESTSVVVMDGGKVREMRAIHIGSMTHQPVALPVKASPGEPTPTGLDVLNDPEEDREPVPEDEGPDPIEIQRRLEQAVKRIRRELGRTISAARTKHPIDAVYVCGRELPGLVGSSILDVPIYILDVFEEDGGQPADGFGELAIAYGVAVGRLGGGVLKPSLRREQLRYSGAFERLEVPLAVVCILLVTLLGALNFFSLKDRQDLDESADTWVRSSINYLMGNLKSGTPGNLTYPSDEVRSYTKLIDVAIGEEGYPGDLERSRFEQMLHLKALLAKDKKDLEKQLGNSTDVAQPMSALTAMTLVLDELDKTVDAGARPSLRSVTATYQPSRKADGSGDTVLVELDLTFFAENSVTATGQFEDFRNRLQSQAWASNAGSRQTDPLDGGEGIYVEGFKVTVDLSALEKKKGVKP